MPLLWKISLTTSSMRHSQALTQKCFIFVLFDDMHIFGDLVKKVMCYAYLGPNLQHIIKFNTIGTVFMNRKQ